MADECEEWQGYKTPRGYGRRTVKNKLWWTHRYAWFEAFKFIPPKMSVLHHCDNPSCIKVEHLFLGTQADNMRDMQCKNRGRKWEAYYGR